MTAETKLNPETKLITFGTTFAKVVIFIMICLGFDKAKALNAGINCIIIRGQCGDKVCWVWGKDRDV
jgi:hypothetical protein